MEMTTIALPKELKDELAKFGYAGENFSDVVYRLLKRAREQRLRDFLMSEDGCLSVEDALEEARRKWPE